MEILSSLLLMIKHLESGIFIPLKVLFSSYHKKAQSATAMKLNLLPQLIKMFSRFGT